ncbi:septal ring lytic transglycosylase RlpA family protein [Acuticoccus mangrovi]|uniref:Endolytic peptidoglycan transglycosylase RlpA n=1 Tax=Acuticoccus mangrovi TaxID=2796142 RepID=A0A934IL99_9HYPH|nr:septal ring lytic transglycosylase RlpA family protein [Acuticoccus mangrovi]MBJ3774710.1 septal ring lytic transglycosylase RlpA family protein [Acuticoccus mangrovi]
MPFALLMGAVSLAGCNGTIASLEPALSTTTASNDDDGGDGEGRKMIGKPYKVGGRWFHPQEDKDYDEVGMASWYGADFHGKRTANGERFNQNALSAAHPTLPLPSYVRVTAVKSGKSVVVRVNDRGPFHKGRIIDVSRAAADELGIRRAGRAKVRVEYLGEAEIGGGDKETHMAALKYGTTSKKSKSKSGSGGLFGFGKREEKDEKPVEVRLAAAAPTPSPAGSPLPGVNVPIVHRPEPVTAVAFQETEEAKSGAIDAVIAMNADGEEEMPMVESKKPVAIKPLPATALEHSEERVMGAHDLFAAIDTTTGGAGELHGSTSAQPQ